MPLEVIGAGFGRTGTMSLHLALEKLGYVPYPSYDQMINDPTQDTGVWTRAYDNPDTHEDEWEKVYGEYRAAVDWPTVTFYKELSQRYPNAKVILTVRSAESWYKSMHNTIFATMKKNLDEDQSDKPEFVKKIMTMVQHTALGGILEKDFNQIYDQEFMCNLFNNHIEEVKRTIPADRLLVVELGCGWEPICKFLGKEVPNEPYPSTNTTEDFNNRLKNISFDQKV